MSTGPLPARVSTPLVLCLLAACATAVPRYDYRPPDVRLEARGLEGGDVVLRPGSRPVERQLGSGEGVHLSVVAVDGGGVRRIALVGRLTVGCHDPGTGALTTDETDVVHEDVALQGPAGTVRTTASVARRIRVSDYAVRCAVPGTRPWVEGTFHGEAEDFHGRWSSTAAFTFWFEASP